MVLCVTKTLLRLCETLFATLLMPGFSELIVQQHLFYIFAVFTDSRIWVFHDHREILWAFVHIEILKWFSQRVD